MDFTCQVDSTSSEEMFGGKVGIIVAMKVESRLDVNVAMILVVKELISFRHYGHDKRVG